MSVGRNNLCPCGSGNKYKKCCLPKEAETERLIREQEDLEWNEWFEADLAIGRQNIIAVQSN